MSISQKIQKSVPLGPYTTMHIGGPARFFLEPCSEREIIQAMEWAEQKGVKPFIMGFGSNLVVSDKGYAGLVIRLDGKLSGVQWQGNRAKVKAGTRLEDLIEQAIQRGLAGVEGLAGIPGSIGGAVYMNAGAYGQCTSERLVSVTSLSDNKLVTQLCKDMEFAYRRSPYTGNNEVIVEAEFEFTDGSPGDLQCKYREIIGKRRSKQPRNQYSAGSIFQRPPGNYAGYLIEQAGLKGRKIGGAMVSEKHAGFIVNTGNAKAEDVRNLVLMIVEEVEKKHGVRLETEVVFLGDFDR